MLNRTSEQLFSTNMLFFFFPFATQSMASRMTAFIESSSHTTAGQQTNSQVSTQDTGNTNSDS